MKRNLINTTDTKKYYAGYLTIYMALSLMVIMALITVLLEGARQNTIRTEIEIVADTAMNSALAEYHRELLAQYDLFFIDTSYGTPHPQDAATAEHIRSYMNENFKEIPLASLQAESIVILEKSLASDENGQVLYNQIIRYMQDYTGIAALDNIMRNMQTISSYKIDTRDAESEWKHNQTILENQPVPKKEIIREELDLETGEVVKVKDYEEVPIENPADAVNQIRNMGVLHLVLEDPQTISTQTIQMQDYLSKRNPILTGTGVCIEQQHMKKQLFSSELTDKALLTTYLFQKCGYYGTELEKAHLKYQLEYILSGKESDVENLRSTVHKLIMMREMANVIFLNTDTVKKAEIKAMAAGIAAVAVAPYLQPILETSIMFAWAYVESLQDVKALLAGGKIPVIKNGVTWKTDLESILSPTSISTGNLSEEGLSYQNYLQILLYMEDDYEVLTRLMDIMEMDIRRTRYNENFRMDACMDSFQASGVVSTGGDRKYTITRRYLYE